MSFLLLLIVCNIDDEVTFMPLFNFHEVIEANRHSTHTIRKDDEEITVGSIGISLLIISKFSHSRINLMECTKDMMTHRVSPNLFPQMFCF